MMYILKDWAGNHLHPDKSWDTFDDGWSFIMENYDDADNQYDDLYILKA